MVASELKKKMKEDNIVVYDGKGPLEHITFQVANIGQITRADMNHFLRVLRAVLAAGTGAAQSVPAHRIQPLESVNAYDIQTARS
jgi:aspartate aminotransferase-like enzyme